MYEVGQIVRIVEENPDGNSRIHIGDVGVIKDVYDPINEDFAVAVEFDHNINGWDCDGICEYGYGWNLRYGEFELCEDDEDIELSETDIKEFLSF